MNHYLRIWGVILSILSVMSLSAQKDIIRAKTSPSKHKGRVVIDKIKNVSDTTVKVKIINEYEGRNNFAATTPATIEYTIERGQVVISGFTGNVISAKLVTEKSYKEHQRYSTPQKSPKTAIVSTDKQLQSKVKIEKPVNDKVNLNVVVVDSTMSSRHPKPVKMDTVLTGFYAYIDSIPFYSSAFFEDSLTLRKHIDNLQLSSINKTVYIQEQNLAVFLSALSDTLTQYRQNQPLLIDNYLSRFAGKVINDSLACKDSLYAILESKIRLRETLITSLKTEVDATTEEPIEINWTIIATCAGLLLLFICLFLWYYMVNRTDKQKKQKSLPKSRNSCSDVLPTIEIIGNHTEVKLRKQSLDNVLENESYLKIPSSEFCTNSAVRNIYIKNVCIKDIYNMYADDLRNPNNPKEDGCMVLGRWVYDDKQQLYDVSLEEVVRPGDDAVFAEYELNFGGKISLKKTERLRKLRNETSLQYDLTCWVHSHPGLGVFFSDADNNVHQLLKHHSHPGFLTALVIDILTERQDTGIFTFKTDGTITAQKDLTKLYSLEEMYKWALDSERQSFDANSYFNALGTTPAHFKECHSIQLSNGAIIDMSFLTSNPNGFIGFVHGFTLQRGETVEYITSAITKNETATDSDMLGCFLVTTHCSTPSIRKAVAKYLKDIHFVLVYTTTDGMLTSIPIVGQDVCTIDKYYGEQKLEDLKIWTRRRR